MSTDTSNYHGSIQGVGCQAHASCQIHENTRRGNEGSPENDGRVGPTRHSSQRSRGGSTRIKSDPAYTPYMITQTANPTHPTNGVANTSPDASATHANTGKSMWGNGIGVSYENEDSGYSTYPYPHPSLDRSAPQNTNTVNIANTITNHGEISGDGSGGGGGLTSISATTVTSNGSVGLGLDQYQITRPKRERNRVGSPGEL